MIHVLDKTITDLIEKESVRQKSQIQLIASENFASAQVLNAQGSILTNKYAEGYPKKRYYSGCSVTDEVETIAIERLKKLFNVKYANVQPHSGSQANQAVFLALLNPGDKVLGMSLDSGGHLTHGAGVNLSGRWFNSITYNVRHDNLCLDYNQIEELTIKHKPRLIIAGYSSYNKSIDFAKFRFIADKVGAFLLADIAHISGIIAAGYHPSPVEHAHVITSTTHKTLRGPRGGIIMTNDKDIISKVNFALFPGLQGGPFIHTIAAKAVAFHEALNPSFKEYILHVLENSTALSNTLQLRGYNTLGDTENHIVLVDLRDKKITGKIASDTLEKVGIILNKNVIPFDNISPFITSGIRMGSPACTSLGMRKQHFVFIGNLIADILDKIADDKIKT